MKRGSGLVVPATAQGGVAGARHTGMADGELRAVLEWLGLLDPDPSRREPIAVPRWAPFAVALALVTVAAIGAITINAMLGSLAA